MLQLLTLIHLLYLTHFGIFSLLFCVLPSLLKYVLSPRRQFAHFVASRMGLTMTTTTTMARSEKGRVACFCFYFVSSLWLLLACSLRRRNGRHQREVWHLSKAHLLFKLRKTLCTLVDKAHFMPLQIKSKTSMLLFDMALPPSKIYQTNEAKLTTIILPSTKNKVDSEPN